MARTYLTPLLLRPIKPAIKIAATLVLCGCVAIFLNIAARECIEVECRTPITADNEQHFIDHGMSLIKSGDYDAAEKTLRKVLAYDPTNFVALTQLAGQLRHRGHYPESESLFLRAIAVRPSDEFIYIDIGKLYRNMGDSEKALAVFKKAEALNPNQSLLWSYGYAELYNTLDEYDKAEAADLRALSIDPSDHFTYLSLGNVYRREKKYDDAVQAYLKSIELDPKSEAYFGLGYTFLEQNKLDESESWFKKYIGVFPAPRGEVYSGLGLIAKERGQYFKAIQYFVYAHYLDSSSFHLDAVDSVLTRMKISSKFLEFEGLVYSVWIRSLLFLFHTPGEV